MSMLKQSPESTTETSVMKSTINPAAWKAECERVASRLEAVKFEASAAPATATATAPVIGGEWRAHVGRAKRLSDAVAKLSTPIEAQLKQFANDVAAVEDRINAKETLLNTSNKFGDTIKQYKEAKEQLTTLEAKHASLFSSVESQTQELTEITGKLDTIKKAINTKGKSMTDMSPLVRIKTALQTIKAEIKDFDLRIGVLSHVVLQAQMREGNPQENSLSVDDDLDIEEDE